jgi:hypothetical protein
MRRFLFVREDQTGSFEFRMGDAVPAETLNPQDMVLSRSPSVRRWRLWPGAPALVKPGLPTTAFGGKGLTRASAPAPVPPCVRRRGGAGSRISTHSLFKGGIRRDPSQVGPGVRIQLAPAVSRYHRRKTGCVRKIRGFAAAVMHVVVQAATSWQVVHAVRQASDAARRTTCIGTS